MNDPVLRTPRLVLTPLDIDADAGDLHPAYADPVAMRYWHEPVSPDLDTTRARLRRDLAFDGAHYWTVRTYAGGPAIGFVNLGPGIGWFLRREHWEQGYASEAATAVVEHALGPLGLDRVEAWVDAPNHRSLGVARRAGLTERGRFWRGDPPRETVVLGRGLDLPERFHATTAVLPVRDLAGTLALLCAALGAETGFAFGDPPTYAEVRLGPWTTSPSIALGAEPDGSIEAVELVLHAHDDAFALHARAVAAGATIEEPAPETMPWYRREFTVVLPEGHRLRVSVPAG